MLRCEGIAVNDDYKPAPDNVIQSDDVLPTPLSLIFGFHGVDTLCHSGNFPVGRANMKTAPIPRIQHIPHIDFFTKFYFMEYIKDVFIPETNKRLNSHMKLSEYFCVIGFHLIMACYVGHYVR